MNELKFVEQKFDCLICLNANLPGGEVFDKLKTIPVLAADGAAHQLCKIGVSPDFIIGDLDSFNTEDSSLECREAEVIHIKDQNTNDFEKCLTFAIDNGFRNILILGLHGGQLEHTLNNWSVFYRFSKLAHLTLYDDGRYGFCVFGGIAMELEKMEIVSIIPQEKSKISTKNLKWELNKEELCPGKREGARNRAIAKNVEILVHSGSILVFIDSRLPLVPIAE